MMNFLLFSILTSVDVSWVELLASLSLLLATLVISLVFKLQIEKSVFIACLRAALQLLAVGLLFSAIFDHRFADIWAWIWVAAMVIIATIVVQRRVPNVGNLKIPTFLAITVATGTTFVVVFPLGVFELKPVNIVVIAGITIGNIMPATVLAVEQLRDQFQIRRGEVETLLALGADETKVRRFLCPQIIRTAITQQIERTKVVGLIALPGTMTGLLLAGIDPIEAVLIQLIVMYMILGATVVTVVVVVWFSSGRAFTSDQRLSQWTQRGPAHKK